MSLGRAVAVGSLSSLVFVSHSLAASPASPAMGRSPEVVAAAVQAIEQVSGAPAKVSRSPANGLITFLSVPDGHAVAAGAAGDTPESRALAFLDAYGPAFGPAGSGAVRVEKVERDELGVDHVRLRQMHRGVPVTAGELVVHLSAKGVVAVNGEALDGLEELSVEPHLAPDRAQAILRDLLARRDGLTDLELSEPRLEVFNRGLLESRWQPSRLAWFVEATAPGVRRFAWVDAQRGHVLLEFSQLAQALNRRIHTSASTPALPGTLLRSEGGPATGDTDADVVYILTSDMYNYFLSLFGRDSYDGLGGVVVSSVHYCPSPSFCPYPNAFWAAAPASQMVFGDVHARADDVVGHEYTHGVIEHEANLYFYVQSGALNESYADIFGETVDLSNFRGNDTPGVRWLIGEDIPPGTGLRYMSDPTLFGHPGKLTDPQFVCTDPGDPAGDSGGIHANSGVPNHAYTLMVDGGTYNGFTVIGIGLTKAARVQYRALTRYLTSGSDFEDNSNALRRSCADLVGFFGIGTADCTEVGKALDAVQMPQRWPCAPPQPVVPALCPLGFSVDTLFLDTFEAGTGNWLPTTLAGSRLWFLANFFATTPPNHLIGVDQSDAVPDDSAFFMVDPVALPANARLQFNHSFSFDDADGIFYDGGVVEYSTDGSTWIDAQPLISTGANYGGILAAGNPLSPRSAFVAESWGYTASQLNLSSLAGESVRFRFRMGTNAGGGDHGWFVDDFRIYSCVQPPPPFITVADVAVREGNAGPTNVTVIARLSAPSAQTATVGVTTANGTATAPSDYVAASGTLTFPPGVTTAGANLTVNGDTTPEGNEAFFLNLSNPVGVVLGDTQAEIRIMDEEPAKFYTVTPCRMADTRNPPGPSGGPPLAANATRLFPAAGLCGIPADARAIAINVTVVGATQAGNIRLYPAAATPTTTSAINFVPFHNRANNAIVGLGAQGQMAVTMDVSSPDLVAFTHFLFDVYGYFR